MMRSGSGPESFTEAERLADAIIARVGHNVMLALPLGLGKANHIANALYARARADRSIALTIFTGLTLEVPRGRSTLERRFLAPLTQRVFGGEPPLAYAADIHAGTVPPNVTIDEFFFQAGQWLGSPYAQQRYISANYTHALRVILDRGVNVVAQLVAHRRDGAAPFSLSCNPDLTLDLLALRRAGKADFLFTAETHAELPFMAGDAALAAGEVDLLLDNRALDRPLFAPPRQPIAAADYAAGLHAATLVPDGGTLQIGIGSLGDAVAHGLILRHRHNDAFRALIGRLAGGAPDAAHAAPFEAGLYGCTEMLVEGLLDLFKAGVLKREVDGAVLHAGFFVGSRAFYTALREMPDDVRAKFAMTAISFVNQLYGDEARKRAARVKARFINDAMMTTALGEIVSDGLEDGRVVSGVGGQYNFVAQAFALDDARAVIMLRSTRTAKGKAQSNIRWRYAHTTIPRHLRDIVITEYGIADLRGKSDRDVVAAMLAVTDSRFQDDLLRQARDAGKIEKTYELPKAARDNTPDAITRVLKPAQDDGILPPFPFGTDFTEVEQRLLPALQTLKSASPAQLAVLTLRGLTARAPQPELDRLGLDRLGLAKPQTLTDRLYAVLVRGALAAARDG
jgi:acyl-CoA hydrolase